MGCSGVAAGTGSPFPLFPRGSQRIYIDVDTERNTAQLLVGGAGDHQVFGQHKNISQVLLEPGAFKIAVPPPSANMDWTTSTELSTAKVVASLTAQRFSRVAGCGCCAWRRAVSMASRKKTLDDNSLVSALATVI